MSDDFLPRSLVEPDCAPKSDASPSEMEDEWTPGTHRVPAAGCKPPPPVPPRGAQARFPQTPFPSQAAPAGAGSSVPDHYQWAWAYPSYTSGRQEGGYPHPHSMPSCLPSDEYSSYPGDGSHLQARSHSLPGRDSPSLASLEQPSSLLSNPPLAVAHPHQHPHPLLPYGCMPMAPACCTQYTPPGHHHHRGPGPIHQLNPQPAYHMAYKPSGPDQHHPGHVRTSSMQSEYAVPQPQRSSPRGTQLSMEQRKVFVTYESDSEDHVKEIIKFVALLRHNGFDTHIDVFEQQLNSISKIDCTERYIQEKDYLIIIAISPKYFEVVSGDSMFVERDERTLNTVYIHKQLQNEFIQNGCKNFRFIPVLFPGAKKSHVPTWLQNTHVYSWPKDRDDILRRLMRVEKYNPPPIGELPTIVSIPI
ncbi:E3 ubiquitin ligase TRAF3IP2 isoform X2 [Sardina pilchardus]